MIDRLVAILHERGEYLLIVVVTLGGMRCILECDLWGCCAGV